MQRLARMQNFAITLLTAVSLLVGTSLAGCSKAKTADKADDGGADSLRELLAVQTEMNGSWSFYGPDGKIHCKNAITDQPTDVHNGYFTVAAQYSPETDFNYPYSVYRFGAEPRLVPGCTNLKAAGFMSDGLIPVTKKGERIAVVDGQGNVKFHLDPIGGKEIMWCGPGFGDGMLMVCDSDDRRGYVNSVGKAVITPEYDGGGPFAEERAIVMKYTADGVMVFSAIDKTGKTVFTFPDGFMPLTNVFSNGYVIAGKEVNDRITGPLRLIDKSGKTTYTFPDGAGDTECLGGKYVTYSSGDSTYVCNLKGERQFVGLNSKIAYLGGDRFLRWRTDDGAIVDSTGKVLAQLPRYPIYGCYEGFGPVAGSIGNITFLTGDGKPRPDATFARVGGMGVLNINTDYSPALADPNAIKDYGD